MPDKHRPASSRLQARLAGRILLHALERGFGVGAWLSENALAQTFGVSRTPVRGALAVLSERGLLNAVPRRGYVLQRPVRDQDLEFYSDTASEDDRLIGQLAADRLAGSLPDQISEADLMRRYGATRGLLTRVLSALAQDGVMERRNGHGWRFLPVLDSKRLYDESYRFRLLIEPAALLEPSFRMDRTRAQRLREAHLVYLAGGPAGFDSRRFLELNAEFHEFVAACSGNRFLKQSVVNQNRLRRFFSHLWVYEPGRIGISCQEHIAILNRLIGGDREHAAVLLRRHLLGASRRPHPQGEGLRRPPEAPGPPSDSSSRPMS